MLMDGWCIPLILQDLFITYLALSEGHPPPDIQRPRYRNYMDWLKKQDKTSSESYWKGLLQDFSSPTLVSADYRPGRRDFLRAGKVDAALPEALTADLSNLAREMRITLSTLIQAAWAKSIPSGMGIRWPSYAKANSAYPPPATRPMTRSPTVQSFTSDPRESMTPATSRPRIFDSPFGGG